MNLINERSFMWNRLRMYGIKCSMFTAYHIHTKKNIKKVIDISNTKLKIHIPIGLIVCVFVSVSFNFYWIFNWTFCNSNHCTAPVVHSSKPFYRLHSFQLIFYFFFRFQCQSEIPCTEENALYANTIIIKVIQYNNANINGNDVDVKDNNDNNNISRSTTSN